MTIEESKAAVDAGKEVCWGNECYPIKTWGGNYYVCCTYNGSVVGLTEAYADKCRIKEKGESES